MKSKAQQRIQDLLDADSFNEFATECNTGYLTGSGKVDGRKVYLSAIVSENMPENVFAGFQHHLNLLEKALKDPAPVILLMDIPGHHQSATQSPFPQNPAKLLADKRGMGRWYALHAQLSGKVPQVCVVCARLGAALTFPVALCDAVVMLEDAGMSIGRPDVVEKIIGEKVDYSKLGSAGMHATISGSIDKVVKTETEAFAFVRHYLAFLPSRSGNPLPQYPPQKPALTTPSIADLIPENPNVIFDILAVIKNLIDGNPETETITPFLQMREEFAKEVITGFTLIDGSPVGIIANNSRYHGGVFAPPSCRKATRFISICDAFGIPLIFLADSAGFMVGSEVEQTGIIREAALMLQMIANTTVAKLSVALRRDYTAGVYAMAGPGMNPENFIALPTAVISIYGKAVADRIGNECSESEAENRKDMLDHAADLQELLREGLIDEIIQPDSLRARIEVFVKKNSNDSKSSNRPVLLL